MFRGYYHSFWHDDPTEPSMRLAPEASWAALRRERYERRRARLWELGCDARVKLFVRSNVSHEVGKGFEMTVRAAGRRCCRCQS